MNRAPGKLCFFAQPRRRLSAEQDMGGGQLGCRGAQRPYPCDRVVAARSEVPHALIEAMAVGLPAIGSRIGGIPELLEPEAMVPAGEANPLAALISSVLREPDRRMRMRERNRVKALEYRKSVLRERWVAFYQHVRQLTEEWVRSRK